MKIFAYYLPQYHPIKENNEWWGDGFSEWISVAKARPLFRGHYQPKLPGELGFYDLRLSETREQQAKLARSHGISGFCYWHYWLGNGKRLLEQPFNEVLFSGTPDFPFFLCWANHSWKGVFFGSKGRTLAEQTYGGYDDFKMHFDCLREAFVDKRYIKFNEKPVVHIFNPKRIPECKKYLDYWRELSLKAGFDGLFIIGENLKIDEKDIYGVDAVTYSYHREIENRKLKNRYLRWISRKLLRIPGKLRVYEYKKAMRYFIRNEKAPLLEYPCIVPNWDTTARLGRNAVILHNSTPELFKEHVRQVINSISHKPIEHRILYLKSWNEWAEGNYIEPDRRFGRKYLEALKEAVDLYS